MLNIVIPAAGAGRRFLEAGYTTPKPFLDVGGLPMLARVMYNVMPLMPHRYIVLLRSEHLPLWESQMPEELRAKTVVRVVDKVTEGAACTVLMAEDLIDNYDELVIANSDQLCVWNVRNKVHVRAFQGGHQWIMETGTIQDMLNQAIYDSCGGMIATFKPYKENDTRWSYAKLNQRGFVEEVAEKQPISDRATVGIYYFWTGGTFVDAAHSMIKQNKRVNGEFYVCPVYNEILKFDIRTYPVELMVPMGTPDDYKVAIYSLNDTESFEAFNWDGKLQRMVTLA